MQGARIATRSGRRGIVGEGLTLRHGPCNRWKTSGTGPDANQEVTVANVKQIQIEGQIPFNYYEDQDLASRFSFHSDPRRRQRATRRGRGQP